MTNAAATLEARREAPLAPRWHTALLVGLIVAVASIGLFFMPPASVPSAGGRSFGLYLPLIVVQGSLLFYVTRVGRQANALPALLGKGWQRLPRAAGDLLLATLGWALIHGIEFGFQSVAPIADSAAFNAMLPHGTQERLSFTIVAILVGFSEEVVYRGYLQTQFKAFTRSPAAAITLQALLFGLAHGEQGVAAMARIAIYGALFGVVSQLRGSLLPTILCHIAIDLRSGLGP